jgi:hypothetical protein
MSYTLLRIFLPVAGILVSAACLFGLAFNAGSMGSYSPLSSSERAEFRMVGVLYAMPAISGLLAAFGLGHPLLRRAGGLWNFALQPLAAFVPLLLRGWLWKSGYQLAAVGMAFYVLVAAALWLIYFATYWQTHPRIS